MQGSLLPSSASSSDSKTLEVSIIKYFLLDIQHYVSVLIKGTLEGQIICDIALILSPLHSKFSFISDREKSHLEIKPL